MDLQNKKLNPLKIFAFFASDINDNPDYFLNMFYNNGYQLFALDSKAIEIISKKKMSFSTINDWLCPKDLLEIQTDSWECEVNWFQKTKTYFTFDDICWPEIDHNSMNRFWLDALTSYRLVEKFLEKKIEKLVLIKDKKNIPVIHYYQGSVCKVIWENELNSILTLLEPKNNWSESEIFFEESDDELENIISHLYSPPSFLKDRIAFYASDIEIMRSKSLLQDLLSTFTNNVIIIPNPFVSFATSRVMNNWLVPIISPPKITEQNLIISNQFMKGFQITISLSKGEKWEKIVNILQFHFLHYCEKRWPLLINYYDYYYKLFKTYPPQIIISSYVNLSEWHVPILASQKAGILATSIPHSISINPSKNYLNTDLIHRFDFHLHFDLLSRELMIKNMKIPNEKFIACSNCTDINSHPFEKKGSSFTNSSLKILVLFSPTSEFIHSVTNGKLIFHSKDVNAQLEAIRTFNTIIKDFFGAVSIKYKVHPTFSQIELFNSIDDRTIKNLLPVNTDLEDILFESDIVIGVNYFGSAFIHSLRQKKPYINYFNDEFFELSFNRNFNAITLFNSGIITIHTETELVKIINQILNEPKILEQMRNNILPYIDEFLNNDDYPSISIIINELLAKKRHKL